MFVLDALAVHDFQSGIAPMVRPVLTNANVRNELVINVRALSDQSYDDVRHFLEDAKIAVGHSVKDKRHAVVKQAPTIGHAGGGAIAQLRIGRPGPSLASSAGSSKGRNLFVRGHLFVALAIGKNASGTG